MQNENIVSDLVFKQLQLELENQQCFDCGQAQPQWASVNNGIFICMNCAAMHRSMGVQISFVRSLSMDTWMENQLKLMAIGGNKKLKDFFQNYDLNDESIQAKYNTRASEYHRLYLRCMCENIPFGEKEPSYDIGREQIPVDEARSAEEIMQNNPSFGSDNQSSSYLSSSYLNQGLEYLSSAASIAQQKAYEAAQLAKQRADEAGITEKVNENASYVGKTIHDYSSYAQQKAKENVEYLQATANDPNLKEKAQENVSYVGSSLYGVGKSLWKKVAAAGIVSSQQTQQKENDKEEEKKQEDQQNDQFVEQPKPQNKIE